MSGSLAFKVGDRIGVLLSNIAREHILIKYNPEAAYRVFSTCGAPPEFALELLSGNKVIIATGDGESCSIVDYTSLDPKIMSSYPDPISWSDWANSTLSSTLKYGLSLIGAIKTELSKGNSSLRIEMFSKELFKKLYNIPDDVELGYTWNGYCVLKLEEVLGLWNRRELLFEHEGIEIYILDLLSEFDKFLQTASNIISCVSWIYDQYGGKTGGELAALQNLSCVGNYLLYLVLNYKDNKDRINTMLSVYESVDLRDNDDDISHLKQQIKPVDITKGWDAGYISPRGEVYALRGHASQLLHITLANLIYESYGWEKPADNKVDFELEKRGFLKFHQGDCYYFGYLSIPTIPITTAQKEELVRYAKSLGGSIKCGFNLQKVTSEELEFQTEEFYELLFS